MPNPTTGAAGSWAANPARTSFNPDQQAVRRVNGQIFLLRPRRTGFRDPATRPDANSRTTIDSDALTYIHWIDNRLMSLDLSPTFRELLLTGVPRFSGPAGMIAASRDLRLSEVRQVPEKFVGVTKPGFDRRLTNGFGASLRVRNLGERIIRIEFSYVYVTDPLSLWAFDEAKRLGFFGCPVK